MDFKITKRRCFVLLFILGSLVYFNSIFSPFHFDDAHTIELNPYVHEISNIPDFFVDGRTFSTLPENSSYRPMASTIFAVLWSIGSGATWPFHLHKILLHILVSIFIFLITLKLLNRNLELINPELIALLSGIFFLVHPALSETVNYISTTTTLQAAFFHLLAFWLFLKRPGSKRFILAINLSYLASYLTKEEGITFPAVVILWIVLFKPAQEKWGFWLKRFAFPVFSFFASLAVFLFLYFSFAPEAGSASRGVMPWYQYFFTQVYAWLYYLLWIFRPWGYSIEHTGFEFVTKALDLRVIFGGLSAFLLMGLSFVKKKRYPSICFGIISYYITLLPASSVVVLAEPINEHRYYLSYTFIFPVLCTIFGIAFLHVKSIGFSVNSKVITFFNHKTKPYIAASLLGVSILGLSSLTIARNFTWASAESLWKDTIEKDPKNGRAHNNLGTLYLSQGKIDEAFGQFNFCTMKWPEYKYCYVNKHLALVRLGKLDEARQVLNVALSKDANFVHALESLGKMQFFIDKNPGTAIATARHCVDVSGKKFVPCLRMLVDFLKLTGNVDALSEAISDLILVSPNELQKNREMFFLIGLDFIKAQRYHEAKKIFSQLHQIDSADVSVLYNLGWLEMQFQNWETATKLFKDVIAQKPNDEGSLKNLKFIDEQRALKDVSRMPAGQAQ